MSSEVKKLVVRSQANGKATDSYSINTDQGCSPMYRGGAQTALDHLREVERGVNVSLYIGDNHRFVARIDREGNVSRPV